MISQSNLTKLVKLSKNRVGKGILIMEEQHSVYETKTHFSRLLKKVKAGRRITVTDRGVPVAEIIPHRDKRKLQEVWDDWVRTGLIQPAPHSGQRKKNWPKGVRRPGALKRFFEERD